MSWKYNSKKLVPGNKIPTSFKKTAKDSGNFRNELWTIEFYYKVEIKTQCEHFDDMHSRNGNGNVLPARLYMMACSTNTFIACKILLKMYKQIGK